MLGCPFIGGVICHGRMHDLSGFVFHEHQHIQGLEENGVDDCEVAGPHLLGMILEKRPPILTGSSPDLFHVFADGVFVQLDAQFEQLPLNLLGLPERILSSHLSDEVDGLLWNARFVALYLGFSFPVAAKEVAVPSQQCVRLDDMECRLPELSEASQEHQAKSVAFC